LPKQRAEGIALAGKSFMPNEQKIADAGQEQLLFHATVRELIPHEPALRENADGGRYLVFAPHLKLDYEDAPEPEGKAVAITDGPVQSSAMPSWRPLIGMGRSR